MQINNTKKLTALAMLTSMAFLVGATIRIRGAFALMPFLTYDPKDVVILMGGFMFGPLSALLMSVVVALLEMSTISVTGLYGALMNALSSASFTCTAAFIYSKKRDLFGAIVGLAAGCIVAVVTMLAANYFIVPLYAPNVTREGVLTIMIPVLLPFNLIKTGLNSVLAVLVYKKVSSALKAAGLYKEFVMQNEKSTAGMNIAVTVISGIIAAALLAVLFIIRAIGNAD
jgi:riboflavin transporter FmnP